MERILAAAGTPWTSVFFALVIIGSPAVPAWAKPPRIQFDMLPAVACRDVTDEEFLKVHPGERLFEAKFEISSLLAAGEEDDLREFFFRMTGPQQTLRIVDYSPRTTLASDFNGGITFEEREEKTKGAGLAVSGLVEPVKISGQGDAGTKTTLTKKYELAAPLESVAASGTIEDGFGVYFKLRQSRQTNLEGSKEFHLIFRAPSDWRGDLLDVHCEASGIEHGIIHQFDETVSCGWADFPVALYRGGDAEARAAAERYVASAHQLRVTASASRDEIKRRSYPTVLHELGGLFDVAEPKIPASWLQQILTGQASGHGFENRLPAQVRSAASSYLVAKKAMRELSAR